MLSTSTAAASDQETAIFSVKPGVKRLAILTTTPGPAIEAWQAIRPAQPLMLDRKTDEYADFLFAHRARRVAKHYINTAIIPMLSREAGVPDFDVRGNITSHRARSTIVSRLYNAKEPMTLFELQERLGPVAKVQVAATH